MGLAVAPVFPLNDEDKQHEHCMEWSSNSAHHWCSIFLFSGLSKLESLNLKCCNCITNDDMKPLSGNLHLSVLLFIFSPNDGSKFQAWFSFLLKLYVYSLSLSLYNMHSVFASCINIQNSFFLFHLHLVMNFFMSASFILEFFEH